MLFGLKNLGLSISILVIASIIGTISAINNLYFIYLMIGIVGIIFFYRMCVNNLFLFACTAYICVLVQGSIIPVPLRYVLFAIFAFKAFRSKSIKSLRFHQTLMFLIISLIIPMYGSITSVFHGTPINQVIQDISGYMFYIIGLFMLVLIRDDPKLKDVFLKHFIKSSVVVSLISIAIFFVVYFHKIPLQTVGDFMTLKNYGMAKIEIDGNYRIFLSSDIYVLVSSFYVFSRLINKSIKSNKSDVFVFLLFLSTILISDTRGLWIACALGFFVIYITTRFNFKKLTITIMIILIALFLVALLGDQFWQNASSRLGSVLNFSNSQGNLSNYIRYQQQNELLYEFNQYPILGKGFGATLASGYYRDPNRRFLFELSYLELLYKLGIVGFTIFMSSFVLLLRNILNIKDFALKIFLFTSFVAFLLVSATNPYIVSSLGMFVLVFLSVITISSNEKNSNFADSMQNESNSSGIKKKRRFKKYKIVW